jgi:hypothetical protein
VITTATAHCFYVHVNTIGAEWPAELNCGHVDMQWEDDVLAWARAEGCTAPLIGYYSSSDNSNDSNNENDSNSDSNSDGNSGSDSDSNNDSNNDSDSDSNKDSNSDSNNDSNNDSNSELGNEEDDQ